MRRREGGWGGREGGDLRSSMLPRNGKGILLTLGCVLAPLSGLYQRTAISCSDSDTLKSLIPTAGLGTHGLGLCTDAGRYVYCVGVRLR